MSELDHKQILLESKISRFLLRERLSKGRKPFLVDSIVSKLERTEGLDMPSRLYVQKTNKAGEK